VSRIDVEVRGRCCDRLSLRLERKIAEAEPVNGVARFSSQS